MSAPRTDLPTIEADTALWWQAAAEGRLLLRRCRSCTAAHLYPRPFCPSCWSEDVAWEQASGAASLYTYSVVRFNDLPPFAGRVPYVAAIVELAEGPRLMSNLVDCEPDELTVGMPLQVTFRHDAGAPAAPVFRPAHAPREEN
ncbi:Zn-ribbon domain-containing OB-fold protein [Jatrophihabitans cynanchi]|jgi:uncharacterized OB-fold protein|uniref:Zn-ribbon domain-containing OB-fold protein n=1 Tax=Jatrophihabitans cynanchi TaxID=2944128 RepID=A0ABY7JZI1_9ACTN|nr:Zn-ribbon domain-containing OB-fold protein [Jatrophihabitans sp. SB3-54]WAX56271.1 Zn-ribbon domain-containing OB-fold protein [Jatrophihabitans sp. SB3-54]